jgi:hypothetical protein
MTVRYSKLPAATAGVTTIKCFYKQDGKYGEFYLHVDSHKHTIRFATKDGAYTAVLTEAFAQAMHQA